MADPNKPTDLAAAERAELEKLRAERIELEKKLIERGNMQLEDLKPIEQVELEKRMAIRAFRDRGYLSGNEVRKPRSDQHAEFLMRAGIQPASSGR